jgi:hypothetical protein
MGTLIVDVLRVVAFIGFLICVLDFFLRKKTHPPLIVPKPVPSDTSPAKTPWPFANATEVTQVDVLGYLVELSRWRADADRSTAFSETAEFLCISDQSALFTIGRVVLAGPYPRAAAAICRHFEQAAELTRSRRPPLLVLQNQNLLLGGIERDSFARLLRDIPELKVVVHTGWAGILELLEEAGIGDLATGSPDKRRIEVKILPTYPSVFHAAIARDFAFTLPDWYLEGYPQPSSTNPPRQFAK